MQIIYELISSYLSKTELSKIIQSGEFRGRLLGPLLITGLPLMKNALQSLATIILISLELTAAASAADFFFYINIYNKTKLLYNLKNKQKEKSNNIKQRLNFNQHSPQSNTLVAQCCT